MMGKYWYAVKAAYKNTLFYRSKVISTAVLWILRVGILFLIYSYAFSFKGGTVNNVDVIISTWAIAVYFVIITLSLRHVYRDISEEIKSGRIETKLNKPYNYLLYSLADRFGRGLPHFLLVAIIVFPALVYFVGVPAVDITATWALSALVLLFGGLVLTSIIYSLVGLSAVWVEDADPVYWISDKAVMILGGSYIPVALFPSAVRAVAEYSPFGACMFITHIFNPDFSTNWARLLITQLLWLVVLLFFLIFVYSKANKKLSIFGG